MARFYREIFELEPLPRKPGDPNHYLSDGRVTLVLMPWSIRHYDGSGIVRPYADHFGFKVKSVQAVKENLQAITDVDPQLRPLPIENGPEGRARLKLFARCACHGSAHRRRWYTRRRRGMTGTAMAQQEKFIKVDGLRTRILEQGSGAPVLLLHGAALGSSADVWTDNMPAFAAKGYRAIAPDLPGFGLTENPKDYSDAYTERFLAALMEALELKRADMVGHSLSGRIGLGFAFAYPQRVGKLVVLGTGSLLPPLPAAPKPRPRRQQPHRRRSLHRNHRRPRTRASSSRTTSSSTISSRRRGWRRAIA